MLGNQSINPLGTFRDETPLQRPRPESTWEVGGPAQLHSGRPPAPSPGPATDDSKSTGGTSNAAFHRFPFWLPTESTPPPHRIKSHKHITLTLYFLVSSPIILSPFRLVDTRLRLFQLWTG